MSIIGLQGLRGGTGTTSVTAALAWALQQLGEPVLAIDATSDNMLSIFFNMELGRSEGWARATLDGKNWQDAGLRYTSRLDVLPCGLLSTEEKSALHRKPLLYSKLNNYLSELQASKRYNWILVDLPAEYNGSNIIKFSNIDHRVMVLQADYNCFYRLNQRNFSNLSQHLLVNALNSTSELQDNIYQLLLQTQNNMIPVAFHADEAMAESGAMKKAVGEYMPHSLSAEESIAFATWCLIKLAGQPT